MKTLLSDKADYLNALRNAQQLPQSIPPPPQVIQPLAESPIEATVPQAVNYKKLFLIGAGVGIIAFLIYKWNRTRQIKKKQ